LVDKEARAQTEGADGLRSACASLGIVRRSCLASIAYLPGDADGDVRIAGVQGRGSLLDRASSLISHAGATAVAIPLLALAVLSSALLGGLVLGGRLSMLLPPSFFPAGIRAVALVAEARQADTEDGRAPAADATDQLDQLKVCHYPEGGGHGRPLVGGLCGY
jgi:hypothetical protein